MQESNIKNFRKLLRILEREVSYQMKNESGCCGITTAQCHVLLDLEEFNDSTLTDLSGRLGLDRSSVSRTVDSLVNLNLIERITDNDDRRFCKLRLSIEGKNKASFINNMCNKIYSVFFENLNEEKQSNLFESIDFIINIFSYLRTEKNCCS